MTVLQGTAWQRKYTPDDGDLVGLFYVPALRSAIRYHRLTGYFSAPALALAARGIESLVLNGGVMRMCVGCTLNEPEIKAIEKGLPLRSTVEHHLLASPLESDDQKIVDGLELLAWMVAHGHLEVKVCIPCDKQRKPISADVIFHEKSGIFEDKAGDRIAFTGSINETYQGWKRNWESFSVFTSWGQKDYVDDEEDNFAKIWVDKAESTMTLDVGEAVKKNLLRFLPDPDRLPRRLEQADGFKSFVGSSSSHSKVDDGAINDVTDQPLANSPTDERSEIWHRIATAAMQPNGGERVGEVTSTVDPWPHQIRAFNRLYQQWPPKLLIADEVGLGKTIQAGLLLRQAWLARRTKRVLILAPKSVCKQWQLELREKFNLDWPIYDGQKLSWLRTPARPEGLERDVSRAEWHKEPFVLMSSHLARRKDRQPELLFQADPWDLVIVDEAHHARRRGAGTAQDGGPNALLRLLRSLKDRTQGLVLLTATPMQVHPVELWDLLQLLGMPPEWTADAFESFFRDVAAGSLPNDRLERLAYLFRANETFFQPMSREDAQRWAKLSGLKAKKVLEALREKSSIPRRSLSPDERKAAAILIKRSTPVRSLVSRHTRELLRAYHKAGKISTPVATRKVNDRFIDLSFEEAALYKRVEDYISTVYDRASSQDRNAVGFVMTIYRRRLASSFRALRMTLEARAARLAGQVSLLDELRAEEDVADQVEAGEEIEAEAAQADGIKALVAEESDEITAIIDAISRLPVDTKAQKLVDELDEFKTVGYKQAIVFTQFTDTMDFLRDHLVTMTNRSVICFSGRGGEIRANDGRWTVISREEVKRRFKDGRAEILVCTDAAAEGLNFQYCGALVNYDMPWNPMRVEQRIGRIDRLGQKFVDIRISNLHYKDTVEADVYAALRQRINLFTSVVGGLQPILARLPGMIQSTVLSGAAARDGAVRNVELSISEAQGTAVDLDEFADDELDLPPQNASPLSLEDLRNILETPILLPAGADAKPLDASDFRYIDGDLQNPVRVTVDREFYEMHSDSVEFWTPGSPSFPSLEGYSDQTSP
ncbi:helicase-related protein [Methylobacterium phyllosphaerae]